ncbi:hypothetical protein NKI12_14300 [Mesorhizobium australicum]|uniref:Uncharacterized protein n=1 Tax=Mesorhizobium australicum TaxID=536018 RepID=A0ACC6T1P0_9HYPH
MARAFLGSVGSAPKVAFLWSLGHGDEARGYGKTRHLLWFAARVNEDFGQSVGRLAGRGRHPEKLLAAYASFNTAEGLSLSNLLFDVVLNLARSEGLTLAHLRAAATDAGRTPGDIYKAAAKRLRQSEADWFPGLLSVLSSKGPTAWIEYLESFRQWHKVRYGPGMLRTSVAFLKEIGIDRLLILVDQVEDFASFSTPTYKLKRDFDRLALLCSEDRVLRGCVTFVLTMHPRAARILSRYWHHRVLGPVRVGEGAQNVVQLGAMNKNRFISLVEAYLDTVRTVSSRDRLRPFREEAIEFVHELERGRPGYCLQRLYFLLHLAATEGVEQIERSFVERCLAKEPAL